MRLCWSIRRAVTAAAAGSHPGVLIVAGTTALFLGAAIGLRAHQHGLYDRAGWRQWMEAIARIAVYISALLVLWGVDEELGSGQTALKAVLVLPSLLCLLCLLASSTYLWLRERSHKKGAEKQSEQGTQPAMSDTAMAASLMVCLGWLLGRRIVRCLRTHGEKEGVQK
jgi:hypothetical protein